MSMLWKGIGRKLHARSLPCTRSVEAATSTGASRRPARRSSDEETIRAFHALYYARARGGGTWYDTNWLGRPVWKCPLDLWIYQELLAMLRPDFVIETGTLHGGSAFYLASVMDLIGAGRVISIDIADPRGLPAHPRVTLLQGSSVSDNILREVIAMTMDARSVMVILDSDHRAAHVGKELRAYSDLVSGGGYMIVEDTNVNGHPVLPNYGPGPMEAVEEFLAEDRRFAVDKRSEKFLMTFNPNGFLRKVGDVAGPPHDPAEA